MDNHFPITALQFPGKSHIRQIKNAASLIWFKSDRTISMAVAINEALRQHREYLIKTENWKRGINQTTFPKLKKGELLYKNVEGKWIDMGGVMES